MKKEEPTMIKYLYNKTPLLIDCSRQIKYGLPSSASKAKTMVKTQK